MYAAITYLQARVSELKEEVSLILGCIVILFTISLNLFIIFTVVLDKSMRNYTNVQFASLSFADALVGSVAMPLMLASNTTHGFWPYSENLCIVFIIGDFVGGNVGIITLVIISYYRLECIRNPYLKKKTKLEMILPALIIWPVVFAFWTLLSIYNVKFKMHPLTTSDCFLMFSFEITLLVNLFTYVFPFLLLVYFQYSIYINLKKKNKFIQPTSHASTSSSSSSNQRDAAKKTPSITFFSPNRKCISIANPTTSGTLHKANKLQRCHSVNDLFENRSRANRTGNLLFTKPLIKHVRPVNIFHAASIVVNSSKQLNKTGNQKENERMNFRDLNKSTAMANFISEEIESVDSTHNQVAPNEIKTRSSINEGTYFVNDRKSTQRLNSITSTNVNATAMSKNSIKKKLSHQHANNKKAFRILFFVTCTSILFWLPWIITWPIQAYCECVPKLAYASFYWMEYLNSLINCIILVIGNQNFRKKLFFCYYK